MTSSLTLARDRLRSSRNRLLWILAKGFLVPLVCIVAFYGIATLCSTHDIWPRRIVRETPLQTPFPVKDIQGNRLITASDSFKLAGVILPTNAHDLDSAETFIRLATAQGVEVIRQVSPSSCMIRCEPRILHSHSDYRVEAHFEQHNLNELILALGYASFDPDEKGLTDLERHRLAAAHTAAQMQQWGIWETAKSHYGERVSEEGIYQSSISILNLVFKLALQESETRNKPKP